MVRFGQGRKGDGYHVPNQRLGDDSFGKYILFVTFALASPLLSLLRRVACLGNEAYLWACGCGFLVAACAVLPAGDWDDVRIDLVLVRLNWSFDVSLSASTRRCRC